MDDTRKERQYCYGQKKWCKPSSTEIKKKIEYPNRNVSPHRRTINESITKEEVS